MSFRIMVYAVWKKTPTRGKGMTSEVKKEFISISSANASTSSRGKPSSQPVQVVSDGAHTSAWATAGPSRPRALTS